MKNKNDESRIAEQIVSVLPADVMLRACSPDRDKLRYAVRGEGIKLTTIVLSRRSLRKLADDPARDIKIEYLQRDLVQTAQQRAEYTYPRPHVAPAFNASRKLIALKLPLASIG
jgi:hypothetical protein